MSHRHTKRRRPGPTARRRVQPAAPASALASPRKITEDYHPPAPRALPEIRGQLTTWLASEGERFYAAMALTGRQWLPPRMPLAAGATWMAAQEAMRILGELYWVSAAMTELARHAAPKLPSRNFAKLTIRELSKQWQR